MAGSILLSLFAIEMYKGLHDLHGAEWVAGWIFATICLAFALWILWDLIRDYYRT